MSKLLEAANNVTNFGDVWDVVDKHYQPNKNVNNDFEFLFRRNEVVCNVVKITKKTVAKDQYEYKREFVFAESGQNVVEAFKRAVEKLTNK